MNKSDKSGKKTSSLQPSKQSLTNGTTGKTGFSNHQNPHHDSVSAVPEANQQHHTQLSENEQYLAQQYNHLLELTNAAYVTVNKDGFIIDYNLVASRILGKSPASLLQLGFTDLLEAADVPVFNAWLQKAWIDNAGLYLTVKLKNEHSQTGIIEITAFVSAYTGAAKLYLSLQNTDEQQRKKESEERYKTLIEQSYDGVIIYDLSGAILDFNDKAFNYLGYTQQEFEKLSVRDLFYAEDILKNPITFTRLKEGKPVLDHRKLKRKDGSGIEMEINSKMMPDGTIIVFGRDISQRTKEAAEMQLLSKIIQNSRDEIFLLNPLTMIFEYANEAALKSVGYTSEELYKLTPDDINSTYSNVELQEILMPLRTGDSEKISFESIHLRKNKTSYPAEVYVQLIDIGDREVFLCNSRDITEKRNAASELSKKEKYFRTLIEYSSSAIILFDENANFIYQSPVVEKIVGYKPDENNYSSLLNFIHPDDEQAFRTKLFEILKVPGGTITGQYRFRHQLGHYIWLEGSVTNLLEIEYIHALIGNYQDISKRKEGEEKLRAERLLLRTLIDNLPDPIYVKDTAGRKIIANRKDQFFMGLDCEEDALGKTDVELFPGKGGEDGHKNDLELMVNNITVHEKEAFCPDKMGNNHWFLESRIPLCNAAGEVVGLLGIARDITLRKQMENDLIQSNERYQYVTRATFDAVWDWDVAKRTVYRGEGFETLFGYNLKKLNGYIGEWEQLIHKDDLKRVLYSFKTALESDATNWQNEYFYKKANGEYAAVADKAIIIRNSTGTATRMVGAMQDITLQKQTQQKLVETEARFRALVENSADGIVVLKSNGQPTYVSPSFERILGYSLEEAYNLNAYVTTHPDDLPQVLKTYEYSLTHAASPIKGFTCRMKHKDGSWHWLEYTITNMMNEPAINGFIQNFRDVSEKLVIEKKIIVEKELSDSLINNLPGIFFKIQNGKLFRWNKNFELISGYTASEIPALLPLDLFDEADKQKAATFFSQTQCETSTVTELLFITREHLAIPFYFNAIALPVDNEDCIVVMGFDIRERKEREEKLRSSNERFEYVCRATFDAVWDWDIEHKELLWGENFEKYFGYNSSMNKSNIITWNNNIHPDDYLRVSRSLEKVIEGPGNIWADEYRFKRLSGDYAYVQDRGVAIRDKNGKTIRMIGAMHDVTEQKRDEEKVKRLNEELDRKASALSSSNNELEKFAYVASHDLQEPLRMVSSFLQLLQRKYENQLDDTAGKYIHFAVDGANRMKTLINDLLEYSRVSMAKDATGNTDMNEVMNEVKSIFMIRIEETGAVIECEELPVLPGTQKTLMMQLMQNLVGNALKYHGPNKPLIKISVVEKDYYWQFSVADNGIGIDPAFAEKIFVIFQRLHSKDEFSGTGIGLSICKKIVEMYGGRIWVDVDNNAGSIFNFTISKPL